VLLHLNDLLPEHTDSVIVFWYTRSTFISNGALRLQSQCVLCGAYDGSIERMHQAVHVDGLTEMEAGECWTFGAHISR
jgi:hypothetical protein